MVDYYIGTMGFSYRDWAGVFYPGGVQARDYLKHYSKVFNAVEIDSTFYGTPKPVAVLRWKEQSPAEFKICVKVPRAITHEARLDNVGREMDIFVSAVSPLEKKLGAILIQFPPSFDVSYGKIFKEFLKLLPQDHTFVVEFRHPSWYIPETEKLLGEHQICWAATEYPGVPREVSLTSKMIFIRLVGEHGRFPTHDRERIDVTPQLAGWWRWIQSKAEQVHTVYVFFNDDYSGHAPASAYRLKELIGLPVNKPDIPRQIRFL